MAMSETLFHLSYLNLTGKIRKDVPTVQGGGAFYDVYHGRLQTDDGDMLVAIRQLRQYLHKKNGFNRKMAREMKLWSSLSHPNILPLLGYMLDSDYEPYPAFVSEWMTNGNVLSYLNQNSDVDILALVTGIASGLHYLHGKHIIHSDLKSDNVLISLDGTPLLSDFGISRLLVTSGAITSTKELAGSLRWMAVEFFQGTNNHGSDTVVTKATKETDVWAFGMTVSELLTGHRPYFHLKLEGQVLHAIVSGQLPSPLENLSELHVLDQRLWKLCGQCWKRMSWMRPTMADIIEQLSQDRMITMETELKLLKQKSSEQTALMAMLLNEIAELRSGEYRRAQRFSTESFHIPDAQSRNERILCTSGANDSDVLVDSPTSTANTSRTTSPLPTEPVPPHERFQASNPLLIQNQDWTFRFHTHPYSLPENDSQNDGSGDSAAEDQDATTYWPTSMSNMIDMLKRSTRQRSRMTSLGTTVNGETGGDDHLSNLLYHLDVGYYENE